MGKWPSGALFSVALFCLLTAAAGCKRETPAAPIPEASPTPDAAPTPEPVPTAPPVNAGLPAPDPADPLTWPVIVPVGKDGRALVPRTADRRRTDGGEYLLAGNPPPRPIGGGYVYADRGGQRQH